MVPTGISWNHMCVNCTSDTDCPNGTCNQTTHECQSLCADWDVNCDDKVNVLDMIRIGQHFGESGSAHWIREDTTKDGNINVLDMILVGQHWTG